MSWKSGEGGLRNLSGSVRSWVGGTEDKVMMPLVWLPANPNAATTSGMSFELSLILCGVTQSREAEVEHLVGWLRSMLMFSYVLELQLPRWQVKLFLHKDSQCQVPET